MVAMVVREMLWSLDLVATVDQVISPGTSIPISTPVPIPLIPASRITVRSIDCSLFLGSFINPEDVAIPGRDHLAPK